MTPSNFYRQKIWVISLQSLPFELCGGPAGLTAQIKSFGFDALGVDWTRNVQFAYGATLRYCIQGQKAPYASEISSSRSSTELQTDIQLSEGGSAGSINQCGEEDDFDSELTSAFCQSEMEHQFSSATLFPEGAIFSRQNFLCMRYS
jgi:hypothetical protein